MIAKEFEYKKPATLEEASGLLLDCKNALILAGGTELIISLRKGSHRPDRIVDIKNIESLRGFYWEPTRLFIGGNTTWTDIKQNAELKKHFPALVQAASVFGCAEIRNRATIGGNICNASPGAEAGGPCLVYDAKVRLWKQGQEREIPLENFILSPGKTAIGQGEILTGILLPIPSEGSLSAYRRTARVKGQDLATCAVTILALDPQKPRDREVRVGMSAVTKVPARHPDLEDILSRKTITREVLDEAKEWFRENLHPRASSLRGTPDYKRTVMGNMLEILLDELGLLEK